MDRNSHQPYNEGGGHQGLQWHCPRAQQGHRGGGGQHLHVCLFPGVCRCFFVFLKLRLCECVFPPLLNPFFSPMHQQRPLALGADICMYSATKYMNGNAIRHFALTCKFHLQVRMLESVALMLSFWLSYRPQRCRHGSGVSDQGWPVWAT